LNFSYHQTEHTLNKIAIFADVQNIYYTTRQAYQRQFNYQAFWNIVKSQGVIVMANAYAIDKGDEKQKGFQNKINDIGFTIKLKPYIQRADGTAKGDWDVGITIDILEAAKHVDTVILLSGDGDFDLLLQHINTQYKVKSHVYSVQTLTAKSLIDSASSFTPINDLLLL